MVCTYNADLQLHEGILYEITCGLSDWEQIRRVHQKHSTQLRGWWWKQDMYDRQILLYGIRLPQNGKIMPNASSAKECAQVCLGNCSCTAYSHGKDGCSI
jgi:hypothetical protein